MTTEQQKIADQLNLIQAAARYIDETLQARGYYGIDRDECLRMARELHRIWSERELPRNMTPGDIARNSRKRYNVDVDLFFETPED